MILPRILIREILVAAFGAAAVATAVAAPGVSRPTESVLFIGNSFFYAAGSPVRFYRADTVQDLNHEGTGGVPALFKTFAEQAGLDFAVSLETVGGKGLDYHLAEKAKLLARPWDHVVMQGYSTLDQAKPGNPGVLIASAKSMAELLHGANAAVDLRLVATWPRADQVYPATGHWHGQTVEAMALDVRHGYDQAAAGAPLIHDVIPVGEAWLRAFQNGVADPNPYDGIAFGQIDLWTHDHYHASAYGYYLEALMVFADLTALDPRDLGKNERAAFELGFTPAQAVALQNIAFQTLSAQPGDRSLKHFSPVPFTRAVDYNHTR